MSTINYSEKIPNNVNLAKTARCSARSSSGSPNYLHWWATWGPDGSTRTSTSTCAPPSASTRRAGRSSAT